jgi:hypothetical protein
MLRRASLALLTALAWPGVFAGAQESSGAAPDPYLIQLRSRQFRPQPRLELPDEVHAFGTLAPRAHVMAQFVKPPGQNERRQLAALGIEALDALPGRTLIVSAPADRLPSLAQLSGLRWAGPFRASDKLDAGLAAGAVGSWARSRDGRVALTVQFHKDVTIREAEALVVATGGELLASLASLPSVTALFPPGLSARLTFQDAVQYVSVMDPPLGEHNDGAAVAANVTPLGQAPYNLTGAGVTGLVYDSGIVDNAHLDFAGRLLELDAADNVRAHSTHVAGSFAGSGANSTGNDSAGNPNGGTANQWAGMAPAANIRSFGSSGSTDVLYDSAGDLNANFTTAITNGIDLATMSLGNNVVTNGFPCGQLGDYANTAILIDNIVTGSINGQRLIYFESAGNERQGGAPCGQFSTISSPSTAKNSIAVGAINSNDNSITGFTSFGPTDDGRLKPDVTAPGCQNGGDAGITSPTFVDADNDGNLDAGEVQNAYVVMCGTSMATPVTAGIGALVVQQWRVENGAGTRPLPHTMKAILVHTAVDLGNAGPDYRFGWGAVNAQAAVDLVIADNGTGTRIRADQVGNGATDFYTFNSDGSAPVRVSLAWDDPPAARLAASTLVNDLDLRLVGPDGTTFMPFLLNPAQPANAAGTGDDNLNNVEMVVAAAQAGTWTVRVVGSAVPTGPQAYTLITPAPAVPNRPPTADAGGPYLTVEGTDVVLAGIATDPDGDPLTLEWDLDNDGQFDDGTGANPVFSLVGRDGVFTVALRVTDDDGAFAVDTATVTVTNVAPAFTALASNSPIAEGSPVTVTGTISDPGWLDPLSASIDWVDGTPLQAVAGVLENVRPNATLTFAAAHVYGDNGVFGIQACAYDDDTTTCAPLAVGISNVPPTAVIDESGATLINGVPTFVVPVGQPVDFSGRSTDPGSDDLTLTWDWDDGPPAPDVTTVSLVNPPFADPFPSPSLQPRDVTDDQSHAFSDACLYEIRFGARDDDGGSAQDVAFVIVTARPAAARSAGYWYQQFGPRKSRTLTDAEQVCYLALVNHMSAVFSEVRPAATVAEAADVLNVKGNGGDLSQIFDRQLLAAWLNFANGAAGLGELIDTDGDGSGDTAFSDMMAAAEAARLDPTTTRAALEAQKDILERFNTSGH